MLTVKSVHTYYGNIHALKGVSLHVRKGEVVTLVGANGAGKSTLVNTICGMARAVQGKHRVSRSGKLRASPRRTLSVKELRWRRKDVRSFPP